MRTLDGHTNWVYFLLLVDGHLLSASGDKTIRVWNTATWELERTVETGHTGKGLLCLLAHGGRVFSGGGTGDHTIRVWETETWECVGVMRGHTSIVKRLLAHEGKLLSASFDRTIKVWNLDTLECEKTLTGHTNEVAALLIAEDMLWSTGTDRKIKVWNTDTWQCERTLEGHHTHAVSALLKFGNQVISCSYDKTIRVWGSTPMARHNI